ncbi:MAG: TolB family protein, partial [Brevundimonas sp.]
MQSSWMLAAAFGALMTAASPALAQTPASPSAAEALAARAGLGVKELAMMERVSDPRVSPDGRRILYGVRTTDWDGNKGVNALWLADADGGAPPRKLAISEGGVSGARWAPDGQALYFMSSRGGSNQVWR